MRASYRNKKLREEIQGKLSKIDQCLGCGAADETVHHVPPRCLRPVLFFKVPLCGKCHRKMNTGADYTAKEKRSLRGNVRKVEKAVKNIRRNLLDNQ
jgi:hypothetical protein